MQLSANPKLLRIAAVLATLLLVLWTARSTGSASNVYNLLAKTKNSAAAEQDLRQEFYGASGDSASKLKDYENSHKHHKSPSSNADTASTTEGAELGLNGRPRLPPAEFLEQHIPKPQDDGSHLTDQKLENYIDSILNLDNTIFWRMECPDQDSPGPRYQVLRNIASTESDSDPSLGKIKYLFTLDLYNVIDILPRLMSSIIQTIEYLGAENCALSIIEGRSHDGTYAVLYGLVDFLTTHNVHYWLDQSSINPHADGVDRIAELSKLRNMALAPLQHSRSLFTTSPYIIFVNDVALCPDDLLEMIYQHALQNATQTCAMDWVDGGDLFYDAWVSRSMTGNTFFEIPQDMSWAFSRNMFWDEPAAYTKYRQRKPFQVFSCWGGMVVLDALPFLNREVEFRRNVEGECYGGEPQTLASDWVKIGRSKVQTVPYVHVAYSDHEGERVKKTREYVHDVVDVKKSVGRFEEDEGTERIRWREPPPRYRCMPGFNNQWWVDSVWTGDEHYVD